MCGDSFEECRYELIRVHMAYTVLIDTNFQTNISSHVYKYCQSGHQITQNPNYLILNRGSQSYCFVLKICLLHEIWLSNLISMVLSSSRVS